MVKNYFFRLCLLLFTIPVYSQIAITEIYHDTPYNERLTLSNNATGQLEDARKHHWGEFVEIYNYSDRELSLANWYIKDNQSVFWLPVDKTIKSGEFMVIVYSQPRYNTTPFTELFSTTQGKDNQIIKQNQILLSDYKDVVKLGYYAFDGHIPLDKGGYNWILSKTSNRVKAAYSHPNICYTVQSFQLNSNGSYTLAAPNPLDANYKPPIQSYEDMMMDTYQQYYAYLDWSDNVDALVENTCPISIEKIEQSPNETYTDTGKCFTYDDAGSLFLPSDCMPDNTTNPSNDYTTDQLDDIKNSIVIYPNPSTASNQYIVNISWQGAALNKIYNLQAFNSGGGLLYGFSPTSGVNSASFSLANQLPGVFVVNFTLNTGQIISKNILKW